MGFPCVLLLEAAIAAAAAAAEDDTKAKDLLEFHSRLRVLLRCICAAPRSFPLSAED